MSAANDRSPIGVSLALSGAANDEFRLSIGSLAEAMPMTYGVSAEQRNGGGIDAGARAAAMLEQNLGQSAQPTAPSMSKTPSRARA